MIIIYKVMVNMWNGARGIASDDNNDEWNGVEYTTKYEAEQALQQARRDTRNNMLVNYCYIDKIERY